MAHLLALRTVLPLLLVTACSGSTNDALLTREGARGTPAPSLASDSSSPLAGTWDVITSSGKGSVGILEISARRLAVDLPSFSLDVDLSGTTPKIAGAIQKDSVDLTATHRSSPLDLGILPFEAGGTWQVVGARADQCRVVALVGSLSVDCAGLRGAWSDVEGKTTARRDAVLASKFGELGGKWTVTSPMTRCAVTLEDNQMTAACRENGATSEVSIAITFGDDVASGTIGGGAEISAEKR